jgi:hypothetical protein
MGEKKPKITLNFFGYEKQAFITLYCFFFLLGDLYFSSAFSLGHLRNGNSTVRMKLLYSSCAAAVSFSVGVFPAPLLCGASLPLSLSIIGELLNVFI